MKKRKHILLIVTALFLLGICATGVSAATYSDTTGHWAESTINEWSGYGVIEGFEGSFRPDDSITRGEMAVIINRIFNYSAVANNTFNDLGNDWYTDAILKLNAAGVMLGDNNKVRPMDRITREEAVVMIARACGITQSSMTISYADANEISSWAQDSISTMTVLQYIQGNNNYFHPANNITRAEAVTIFDNIQNKGALVIGGNQGQPETDTSVKKGIDVSSHQGAINWSKVKADGIDFAIIRVGYRGYTEGKMSVDSQFTDNIENAINAGVDVGVYFFSQAINAEEAKAEADLVLAQIKNYKITYPVVFDWENVDSPNGRSNDITPTVLTNNAKVFCNTVSSAGYKPMVYFNKYIGLNYYNLGELTNYDFWYASYVTKPSLTYDFKMWQYSSKGSVNGIKGNVDMDISYSNYNS